MSKKHRLINRKSYFNSTYNRECLRDYKNYFKDDKLNDIEIFEITLIYMFEKHSYNGLEYKDVLDTCSRIDKDLVAEWVNEDLSSVERGRILSAILKVCDLLFDGRHIDILPDKEFKVVKLLLEIAGDELDV